MIDWRAEYAALAERIVPRAPAARPLLAGFNACVDHVYRIDGDVLDRLAEAAARGGRALPGGLAAEILDRIGGGRDGEVFVPAPELQPWLAELLGEPRTRQVGGTGAQAAWTLAVLGAPAVLALTDRSATQLSVLDPAIGLCAGHEVQPVGATTPAGLAAKPPHFILEFTAGTRWHGGTVPRSSRIILRLAAEGIDRDADFAALTPKLAAGAGAGLASGLNTLPEDDTESRRWMHEVVDRWRDAGLPLIHLELAEYPRPAVAADTAAEYTGTANSLGLSLTELTALRTGRSHPAAAARDLACRYGFDRVAVHADTWSLVVHRGDPEAASVAVRTGNLLAAARARQGVPTAYLAVADDARFTTDHPAGGPLGDGWRCECAPTPYLAGPAATIGLGDTFVAGLLLADCLPGESASVTVAEPSPSERRAS